MRVKPFWKYIYIYINYCNSMNHHVRHLLLNHSCVNRMRLIRFHECFYVAVNQFKELVKLCWCFIIMQHPNIHLNHLLTMNAHITRSSVSIVPDLWEHFIVYVCSWKKCSNALSIWHHVCLSTRKRNHKSRRTTNQTLKQTQASWWIISGL